MFCEGQSEEAFVKDCLAPHLLNLAGAGLLEVRTIVVGAGGRRRERGSEPLGKGGGHWKHWRTDIELVCKQQRGNEIRLTSLFDLYGLPRDFPALETSVPGPIDRADALQAKVDEEVGDWRFSAYIQVHEFEALVLASLDALEETRDEEDAVGLSGLRQAIGGTPPEAINDGATTAPSKRILQAVPGYSKVDDGPWAIEETGLDRVREACPRFGAWLDTLEAWAAEPA